MTRSFSRRRDVALRWVPVALSSAVLSFGALSSLACGGVADRSVADYGACEADLECKLGSNCFTAVGDPQNGSTEVQMCTRACADDTNCANGVCVGALMSGAGICYERCDANPCHAGFNCVATNSTSGAVSVCLPK